MDVEIDVEVAVDVEVEVEISDAVCQQLINKTCITHTRCEHPCNWPISNMYNYSRARHSQN